MAEAKFHVEYKDSRNKKWWYVAQAWTSFEAVQIAERHPQEEMRVRRVVKTVIWTKKGKRNENNESRQEQKEHRSTVSLDDTGEN